MNQSQDTTPSISINSNHFITHLDTIIIQLSKTISVENGISVDDSIEITRKIITKKAFELFSKEIKEEITTIFKNVENDIIKNPANTTARDNYKAFKVLMGVD